LTAGAQNSHIDEDFAITIHQLRDLKVFGEWLRHGGQKQEEEGKDYVVSAP
jgi:hypothetical protein